MSSLLLLQGSQLECQGNGGSLSRGRPYHVGLSPLVPLRKCSSWLSHSGADKRGRQHILFLDCLPSMSINLHICSSDYIVIMETCHCQQYPVYCVTVTAKDCSFKSNVPHPHLCHVLLRLPRLPPPHETLCSRRG